MLSLRHSEDTKTEVGLDEAGRGCFWGPLMAGAVLWPPRDQWTQDHEAISPQIRDSKKIAPKKRLRLADDIKRLALGWAVGSVTNTEIDEQGIVWANQEAFRRALQGLEAKVAGFKSSEGRLLIDGEWLIPEWSGEQHAIVEGDNTYLLIGAASILAKVEHDLWIQAFCEKEEAAGALYDLKGSKGYGTAKHRAGLMTHGAHGLHRRTFIRKYVTAEQALPKPNVVCQGHANRQERQEETKCLIRLG
jgi:ribonuclease HII